MSEALPVFNASEEDAGLRLDHYLVARLPNVSRVRVQQLVEQGKVLVNARPAKASLKLKGTEQIEITGTVEAAPLKAVAEDIPLTVVFEDKDLAVVNKPAGMIVHASAGSPDDARNKGTLVNALLFRFNKLSGLGGELRPGIVHRLDKDTSGLIVVAKNDVAHRKLVEQFSSRQVHKTYIALVHNWPKTDQGTVNESIGRDPRNRTRMSTAGIDARTAVSHYKVIERLLTPYGRFALIEVRIETGRTHQIRVHMGSIGHPIVGDTLYGAPQILLSNTLSRERHGNAISSRSEAKRARVRGESAATLSLSRNFLHAARLNFNHPKSARVVEFEAPLPEELQAFLEKLRHSAESLA
ncbi:MAG: RluA family pseudouridine synthase [Acidobacteria bacterium]|nr:MAG: RluA family pseudouridine synthase [Acidobacteriota bacterium]